MSSKNEKQHSVMHDCTRTEKWFAMAGIGAFATISMMALSVLSDAMMKELVKEIEDGDHFVDSWWICVS